MAKYKNNTKTHNVHMPPITRKYTWRVAMHCRENEIILHRQWEFLRYGVVVQNMNNVKYLKTL